LDKLLYVFTELTESTVKNMYDKFLHSNKINSIANSYLSHDGVKLKIFRTNNNVTG
jgi:hypothetical protein